MESSYLKTGIERLSCENIKFSFQANTWYLLKLCALPVCALPFYDDESFRGWWKEWYTVVMEADWVMEKIIFYTKYSFSWKPPRYGLEAAEIKINIRYICRPEGQNILIQRSIQRKYSNSSVFVNSVCSSGKKIRSQFEGSLELT